MQRRTMISQMVAAALVPALVPFPLRAVRAQSPVGEPQGGLRASHQRWREILPADRYRVLFEEATEPPRSSPLDKE